MSAPAGAGHAATWREAAACRAYDPEWFFPVAAAGPAAAEIRRAKAICAACLVRRPCLAFALDTHQEYGIWGGYDERERRILHWRRHQEGRGLRTPGRAGRELR